jgi:hypothetical protein
MRKLFKGCFAHQYFSGFLLRDGLAMSIDVWSGLGVDRFCKKVRAAMHVGEALHAARITYESSNIAD